MLKYYLCLYLLLYLIRTYAQSDTIAFQGFEDTGSSWNIENFSTPPCSFENDSWDFHTGLGDIVPSEGTQFWGVRDLNGNCGSSGFEHIQFDKIDISNFRNVSISFDLWVIGYDNGDDIKYQLWIDDIAQPEEIIIDGENNLTTESWIQISASIPNSASTIGLRISIKQNGDDLAGIDNFRLSGDPVIDCSELLISEYLEGSSSRTHRNNYLELYNPHDTIVDLNAYQIVKYTGSRLEPSSTLNLNGFLASHDTFLIEDDQETLQIASDLSTNSAVMNFNGDDKIALVKNDKIIDILGDIGDSVNFGKDVTLRRKTRIRTGNNEFTAGEWDEYALEDTGNLNAHVSYCQGNFPEIEIWGGGLPIADGSLTTTGLNNTYFGAWSVVKDTVVRRPFMIKNTGNASLRIDRVDITGEGAGRFFSDFLSAVSLQPGDSLQLEVSYIPNESKIHSARLEITNNDPSENPFDFILQGEGTGTTDSPLLISQYYEGNANNKWIEITNISGQPSSENTFYLALYRNEDTYHPIGIKPSRKVLIPALAPGQSLSYSASLTTTSPEYALDGQIKTSVCSFTGDDIIVISTSMDASCWADRVDIVGQQGNWGQDLALVRKYGCQAKGPNTGFEISDWFTYPIEQIDDAAPGTNTRIGIHHSGPTTWSGNFWSNGVPDINRTAIIDDNYDTGLAGDFEACSLKLMGGNKLSVGPNNYLTVNNNLLIEGRMDIEHGGSFIMIDDHGTSDIKGEVYIHKTASDLKPYDYTYWAAPTVDAKLEEVFWDSPQNSFYQFSTNNFKDTDGDGIDDNNDAWVAVSGVMQVARGYTAMAPDATPFKNNQEVSFGGTMNNGRLAIPLSLQNNSEPQQHHWNLVGNPYPSSLDAELLLNHPENSGLLSGTFYFWTHQSAAVTDGSLGDQSYTSDDYAVFTVGTGGVKANENGKVPTKYINSCQGFFVEALREGDLIFNNSMRTSVGNKNFFKPANTKDGPVEPYGKIWLNLSSNNGAFSQILIGFVAGATEGYDHLYDGQRLNSGNVVNFYSLVDNYRLAIQGLPPFNGEEIIRLGIKNTVSENISLKISIDHMTGPLTGSDVFLYDRDLKKVQNLNQAPYFFNSLQGQDLMDRFELRFKNEGLVEQFVDNPTTKLVWNRFEGILSVKTNQNDTINRLEIFDLNGRKLRDLLIGEATVQVPWSGFPKRAIYILRARLENSRMLISKIIP